MAFVGTSHLWSFVLALLQSLNELLEDDEKFGFIVMDGLGCLYGTLSGNTREVLHRFTVGALCTPWCMCACISFAVLKKYALPCCLCSVASFGMNCVVVVVCCCCCVFRGPLVVGRLTCPRSTAVVVSPPFVSLASVWRSVACT